MPAESVIAESAHSEPVLSDTERSVYSVVLENWPASALDIALHLGEDLSNREEKRKASTKYSYYLRKLVDKRLVVSRPVGNGFVVWPLVVEKYRAIHDILSSAIPSPEDL